MKNCNFYLLIQTELLEYSEDRYPWESIEEKLNLIRWGKSCSTNTATPLPWSIIPLPGLGSWVWFLDFASFFSEQSSLGLRFDVFLPIDVQYFDIFMNIVNEKSYIITWSFSLHITWHEVSYIITWSPLHLTWSFSPRHYVTWSLSDLQHLTTPFNHLMYI